MEHGHLLMGSHHPWVQVHCHPWVVIINGCREGGRHVPWMVIGHRHGTLGMPCQRFGGGAVWLAPLPLPFSVAIVAIVVVVVTVVVFVVVAVVAVVGINLGCYVVVVVVVVVVVRVVRDL